MLNKSMRQELKEKGALLLIIEAIACVAIVAVGCGALYLAAAIEKSNLSGGF